MPRLCSFTGGALLVGRVVTPLVWRRLPARPEGASEGPQKAQASAAAALAAMALACPWGM